MNNDAMKTNVPATAAPVRFRPKLTFYHPNPKGTGSAAQFELHPAHEDTDGSIMMGIANQMSVGDRRAETPVFPRFDWKNAIKVKLDFNDLCAMLQVFRGECETINDGKGLYHRSPRGTTRIVLRHALDPVAGYSFEFYRTANDGAEQNSRIFFSCGEALGLCEAIAGSMAVISFGIPVVIPHDTSAYEAEVKEGRNAFAA